MNRLIEVIKNFFRPELLQDNKKEFSEQQVFQAAKQRFADVFHLPIDSIGLDDPIGGEKLSVSPTSLLKCNELDILSEEMVDASWGIDLASLNKKLHPDHIPDPVNTVRDYCKYMVCCYRYCNRTNYNKIIVILHLRND